MVATINDATIHYVDEGSQLAMPVIFVHGFPFSLEMWRAQIDAVAKLYRAVAYDIRGHGLSFIGDGQFTIEQHVDDLMALLDHLGIRNGVVVGLSMGGYISLRALERNPERFRGVVLCDTRSEADSNESKLKRFSSMKAVKAEGSAKFAENFVHAVFAKESFEKRPDVVQTIRTVIERTPPLSIAGTLLALASRTDTTADLSKVNIPTMILVGEHDATTPPSASQGMHERIAGSEMHIIPNAAHMSNLENPRVFNDRLLSFLKRVASLPT